jgi:hypothetical protein
LVVVRQAAVFLRLAGFVEVQAVLAHDFLGELFAAERLVARVDDLAGRSAR